MPLPFSPKMLVPVVYAAICWLIVLIDILIPDKDAIANHGIHPRSLSGLLGIFFAPFLPPGVLAALSTTVGILIFGWLLLRRSVFDFIVVTSFALPVGGLAFWIVSPEYATGPALVMCAWFGYLLVTPFFERPFQLINFGVALVTAVVYIVIVFFIPSDNSIGTWIYNLCGLSSGVLSSICENKLFAKQFQGWRSKGNFAEAEGEDKKLLAGESGEAGAGQYATILPAGQVSYTVSKSANPFET